MLEVLSVSTDIKLLVSAKNKQYFTITLHGKFNERMITLKLNFMSEKPFMYGECDFEP